MKNFRRTAALIVAFALCFSLMPTTLASSFDDFSDSDDVTYIEAMDVLVGIGVISGSDGYLKPQDSFTREQAAKMIAYMLLGEETAENLTATGSSFTDVSASRWSAGYIEYLAGAGIINGVGSNQFNPTGYVTGYQFVKMLLGAIGYGVQNEFVGTYWEEYVDEYADDIGAFSNSNASSYSSAATREEAMLYAFNILTGASLVRYSAYAEEYYTIAPNTGVIDQSDEDLYLYTLGYQTFGLYSEDVDIDGDTYRQWIAFDDVITDCYNGSGAVLVTTLSYDDSFYLYELYEELGSEYEITTYTVDGYSQLSWLSDTTINDSNTELIGSDEAHTTVYVDSANGEVEIETYYTYLAYVDYTYSTMLSLTVYLEDEAGSSGYYYYVTDGSTFYIGDFVLVTFDYNAGEVRSVSASEQISGIISVYGSDCIVVNGRYYDYSDTMYLNGAADADDYASTFTFYLNEDEYIVGIILESYGYDEADTTVEGETDTTVEDETDTTVSEETTENIDTTDTSDSVEEE